MLSRIHHLFKFELLQRKDDEALRRKGGDDSVLYKYMLRRNRVGGVTPEFDTKNCELFDVIMYLVSQRIPAFTRSSTSLEVAVLCSGAIPRRIALDDEDDGDNDYCDKLMNVIFWTNDDYVQEKKVMRGLRPRSSVKSFGWSLICKCVGSRSAGCSAARLLASRPVGHPAARLDGSAVLGILFLS
ncbi:hypothetical protein Tco_0787576 [Tanacetum coccineum]